jgi:hypothetical protein
MPIKVIGRVLGCSKNTVKAALVADRPPKYSRASVGSIVDEVEPRIRELLAAYPTMPATVITERIGWARSIRTDTFLGERYRRIAKRRGKKRAIVAVGRSILVIIWHLLSDPAACFIDRGPDFYDNRTDPDRKKRNHIRQLEALGYKVTLEPA